MKLKNLQWGFWINTETKRRLPLLVEIYPAEILLPFTNSKISSLWAPDGHWQKTCSNSLWDIASRYLKSKWLQFIKRTDWVLTRIVKGIPNSGAPIFHTDANKSGKSEYKWEDVNKVTESQYKSVQKSEWYAYSWCCQIFKSLII